LLIDKYQRSRNKYVIFTVEDTGIGMKQEKQDKLARLLQFGLTESQIAEKNTDLSGIGLLISNKIAEVLAQKKREQGGGI
jgi:signal transduction histidine kinase